MRSGSVLAAGLAQRDRFAGRVGNPQEKMR